MSSEVPDDGFTVQFLRNGEVIYVLDDPDCRNPVPPTTSTTTTTAAPDCNTPGYAEQHPDECLPATGPGEIRGTSIGLIDLGWIGGGVIGAGILAVVVAMAWAWWREEQAI